MEQVIFEAIISHTTDWWLGTASMDLSRVNRGLIKPVAFYDGMTGLADKDRAVHVVYWGFSKTFGTGTKQVRYSLPTTGWAEN